MAKVVRTELVDDLDGSVADGTTQLGLNGTWFEIDLSAANASKLLDLLTPYLDAGVKVKTRALPSLQGPGRERQRNGRAAAAMSERDQNRAVREWAQAKGLPVSDRGRIKQEIVDRYHAEAGR